MERITNKIFLEKLYERCPDREYIILEHYVTNLSYILVETKYGNCLMKAGNMPSCVEPSIASAIDKIDFLTRQLEDKFGKRDYNIIGEYINNSTKILVDTEYGRCMIEPKVLLQGHNPNISSAIDKTQYFINKANKIHKNQYLYTDFIYTGKGDKGVFICKIHNIFSQENSSHLSGRGCKKCASKNSVGLTKNNFLLSSKDRVCTFYVINIYNEDENFYKIGITSRSTAKRFPCKTTMPYNYIIIEEVKGNGEYVWEMELKYKRLLKGYNYIPKISFNGMYECFYDITELLEIMKPQD